MHTTSPDALLIFAKYPLPGRVKTRLCPPLLPQQAADLYSCMLRDSLASSARIPSIRRLIFFDGEPACAKYFGSLAPDAMILPQIGNDLGERMANAFAQVFAAGYLSAVIIGSDAPHMPVERVTEAFALLKGGVVDAVFGPSDDGGYYLLGLRQNRLELFRDIPWSSTETLAASLNNAADAGLCVRLLTSGYDLDTIDDLRRLQREKKTGGAVQTRAFLDRLTVI